LSGRDAAAGATLALNLSPMPTVDFFDDELAAVTRAVRRTIDEDRFAYAPGSRRSDRRWPFRDQIRGEDRAIDFARGSRACLCLRAFVADADQFAPVPVDAHDAPLPFPRCQTADERAKHQPIEGHIEELSGGPLRKVERGGLGGFSDIH